MPRPRVSLRSGVMASYSGPFLDGGIESPSSANNKTLLRRLQRKHSEKSYKRMKDKLLSILKPMPLAVHAANLEDFRQSLYTERDDVKPLRTESAVGGIALSSFPEHIVPTQAPDCNRCSWCGIWIPLPIAPLFDTMTDVSEACRPSEPDPIESQLEEVDQAVDALLEVCLCQAPCALVHEPLVHAFANKVDLDVGRPLGTKKYCFKRTRAPTEVPEAVLNSTPSASLPPVSHPRYTADESTGECITQ